MSLGAGISSWLPLRGRAPPRQRFTQLTQATEKVPGWLYTNRVPLRMRVLLPNGRASNATGISPMRRM